MQREFRRRERGTNAEGRVTEGNERARFVVDDEIVELKEWDAVRVPPGSWRGYEAGPEGPQLQGCAMCQSATGRVSLQDVHVFSRDS
jgi:hypothetical protein